ncbi:phospholipid-translocating p-type flippase family protein, putative [Ichthyophthirius multifiliis]|uniref:Phospholipid-transporting ATPase n=1 Tax=Ichthyophthirius multifiliis TaxID=5932 RepID=G0R2T2_ICHMU|nr:phospholipid-translocating p-type flippase family protein, putative [Ichthyophthirius multifiliis]EGR28204.1 phospholipid-translocating p-type flippase family protein, putative [Ichthyophthirius multifiliis]|eukprot:XP_004027549.1 phospholipid-translocating p-type flippase family protein, putative [Ichthyophthirius multifiliis]
MSDHYTFQQDKYHKNNIELPFFSFQYTDEWQIQPERLIHTSKPDFDVCNNQIHTAKYSILTFLPLNLLEQFSNLPNLYFLVVGLLQMINEITNSERKPVIYVPLLVILIITAIKDIYEDIKRHKQDKKENQIPTLIYKNNKFVQDQSKNIRIGHIIKVRNNEQIPSDMILLYSSQQHQKGICYIETKNLDGETNLKTKEVPNQLLEDFKDENCVCQTYSLLKYEKPNPFLYKFQGIIEHQRGHEMIQTPLESHNFILRGCTLKQTEFIIGVVVYTGHQTKIMLNSVKSRGKKSTIQALMNKEIIVVFLVQIMFCILCAMLNFESSFLYYFGENLQGLKRSFWEVYGIWMLLFTNFIPISLLVTLDMVKFFQGMKINRDYKMVSEEGVKAVVQSSSLNEELGQVGVIFTDKTGTLTCNQLVFKGFGFKGKNFGLKNQSNSEKGFDENEEFLQQNKGDLEAFLKFLVICQEVIVQWDEKEKKLKFHSCSQDDLSLNEFAKKQGIFIGKKEENEMEILKKGFLNEKEDCYCIKICNVLEFTSSRKKMSVIFQKKDDDNQYFIYTKGADSVIFDSASNNSRKNGWFEKTRNQVEDFSKQGFRTLVLAQKIISKKQYLNWVYQIEEAKLSLDKNVKDIKVYQLYNEIENDLEIIGCTAIEDKLQQNVPQSIQKLREAGIQIWMLTGDKKETAINVAILSQIIEVSYKKIVLDFQNGINQESIEIRLSKIEEEIKETNEDIKICLIISGSALDSLAVQNKFLHQFMHLTSYADSMIVCRVSPKQKRQIVDMYRKKYPSITTLAIGDGANDVNMIIGAHVGVGIKGLEGQQAARVKYFIFIFFYQKNNQSSDFVIGEFQFLSRLVLYFGREFYRKNSSLVLYNFYKNIILVLPQFWFGFYNGFSGQFLYDIWVFQLYNILFTSAPIVLFAIFDKEYKGLFLVNNPWPYYLNGLNNYLFNSRIFWKTFFLAVFQASIIGVSSVLIIEFNSTVEHDNYLVLTGNFMYWNIVLLANIKIIILSTCLRGINILFLFLSFGLYVLLVVFVQQYPSFELFSVFQRLFQQTNFWVGQIFIIGTCIVFDIGLGLFDINNYGQYQKFENYQKLDEGNNQQTFNNIDICQKSENQKQTKILQKTQRKRQEKKNI